MRGHGRALGFAALRIAARPPHPRSARPLPVRGERWRKNDVALAARMRPSFASQRNERIFCLQKREAERRKAHHPLAALAQTSVRSLRHSSACAAAARAGAARLPALRSGACQSERTLQLSPGRASRDRQATQALPALSTAFKRSTPRAGRSAGGNEARTARERGYKPRPQEPHSLRGQVCLEITSLTSEIRQRIVSEIGTNVNVEATRVLLHVTSQFASRTDVRRT